MHKHNPSKYTNLFIRFIKFLCNPGTVYSYSCDGTEYCRQCGESIGVPSFYYSPLLNGIYAFAGALFGYWASQITYHIILVNIILFVVFHHIVASLIFTFLSWIVYDTKKFSPKYANAKAVKDARCKIICYLLGCVIAVIAQ